MTVTRRDFAAALAAASTLRAATPRNLKIGHTCITWGTFPRGPEAIATLEARRPRHRRARVSRL